MKKEYYYIGKTLIEISASEVIHKCIELFCVHEKCDTKEAFPFLKYEIFEENSSETVINYFEIYKKRNEKGVDFQLLNIQYIYFEQEKIYIAGNKFCAGIIDISNMKVEWHVYLPKCMPRSLFHLNILDPYSLVCPMVGELIIHGAVILKKEQAILFVGKSGNGKSTITHKLSEKMGYEKLCDDTFILSINDEKLSVYSIDTGYGYAFDIAEYYMNQGDYYELYRNKDKVYIMKKHITWSNDPWSPKTIFFLEREVCPERQSETIIDKLSKEEIFRYLLQNQTNIGSPFLLKKIKLYKKISQNMLGAKVCYMNDCDVSLIDSFAKE